MVALWRPSEPTKHGCTPKGTARVGAVCQESGVRPVRPKGPARWGDGWSRPQGAPDPHRDGPQVSNISRSAVGLAVSGHAQSADMGTGQRGSATAPISGESRHWQGPSVLDRARREQAVADADVVVRAREVQRPKVGPDHERGRCKTRQSAARKRRTVGNPADRRKPRWPP